MKQLFSKQYLLLAIAFCIITSCKLTGNFAIVKRQHERGYYIETPSFVANSSSMTTQVKRPPIDDDNFIASVDAIPSDETALEAKVITNDSYAKLYTKKAIARDSSKKKPPATPVKNIQGKPVNAVNKNAQGSTTTTTNTSISANPPEPAKDDRKLDWVSVTGFGLCLVGLALAIAAIGSTLYLAILAGLFLLAGIIFSFKGFKRISDATKKLKGQGFAMTGIVLCALVCIAAFLAFFYAAYWVFFIMP